MVSFKPLAIAAALATAAVTPAVAVDAAQPAAASGPPLPPARPHHVYLIGSLLVSQPWIAVGGDKPDDASAFLTVVNRSDAPDRLTGASLDGAASVAITAASGDAIPTDGIVVPPNGTLTLKPGDVQLVLHGLRALLAKGPPVDGTVRFERAGSVHVSFLTDPAEASDEEPGAPSAERPTDLAQ